MTRNSETTPKPDIQETLSQLARVKAIFQLRTVKEYLTHQETKGDV